jgi:hypothetical protein
MTPLQAMLMDSLERRLVSLERRLVSATSVAAEESPPRMGVVGTTSAESCLLTPRDKRARGMRGGKPRFSA